MIPLRLSMRNFMCYRGAVPPLSFNGIHTACISGANGSGKSALIDAMTWALWGETRTTGTKISDDDLVSQGQGEMEVEFDFAVGENRHRVIRKRSRPKRRGRPGGSALDFQVATAEGFRSISGDSILQTQAKINGVLHMDYQTFINSAYLRQGHADEFARQTPVRRKEVLGNILGLAVYDTLEQRAKEQARQKEEAGADLARSVAEIEGELARRPDYEAELVQVQAALAAVQTLVQDKEAMLDTLRQKKESLETKKTRLDELEAGLATAVLDLSRWQEQAAQHLARVKSYQEVIGRRDDIEKGLAQFVQAQAFSEEMEKQFRQSVNLERQKAQLEAKIEKSRNELTTEHRLAQNRINELEGRALSLAGLQDRLTAAQERLRQLEAERASLLTREHACRELEARVSFLGAEKTRLEREVREAAEKLDIISSRVDSPEEACCPLCEQELTREGLELIAAKYGQEKADKTDLLARNGESLAQKKAEYESLSGEVRALGSRLEREAAAAQSEMGALRRGIAEVEGEAVKLAELKQERHSLEERLVGRDFALVEQQALSAIEAELADLGYDPAEHEQARERLQQLAPYEMEKNSLDEAARLLSQEEALALSAEEAAGALQERLQTGAAQKEALAAELTGLPPLLAELGGAEADYRDLSTRRSQAMEGLGSVKANLERLARLEAEKKAKGDLLAGVAGEGDIYRQLALAFGKKGIQAWLIEMALPEIEAEANRLLGRMTDNRMHVKMETQKETKKGEVQETLEITIADELGTRPYEMYSGGEAFRVNLAIRIALSRLLARRAGAPLPTLIIDEGFGTQDTSGIEKVREAINSIQDDFEKILVITHIEELRDAFPARIDVIKTAEGSTLLVG